MTTRTPPVPGPPPRLRALARRKHVLPNGLEIVVVEDHATALVEVEVVIRAGASWDTPEVAGRAAMVAEMLDEGTETRSVLQIADEIDYLGAQLGINTGWDSTLAGLHVAAERLAPALDILADIVLHPTFPAAEFARKQREKLNALMQERSEARLLANKALMRGIFGDAHPYGMPVGGTFASVEALTTEPIKAFYQRCYTPANAFIVIVGAVEFDDAIRQMEQHFGAWRGDVVLPPTFPAERAWEGREVLLVDKPRAPQAEIRVGHSAPMRSTPDYFPLLVLNTMLGGSFTSRLNLRLREEMGVTYGAGSKFNLRLQGGLFWAGSAVDSNAAAESVAVVFDEMRRLQQEPIDATEMQRAAQYVAFGLPQQFEAVQDIAGHLREQLLYRLDDDYWERFVDRVLTVQLDEVRDVAARHLQPERAIAVVVADAESVAPDLNNRVLGKVIKVDVPT